jgi:excinuclease ABC subunit C
LLKKNSLDLPERPGVYLFKSSAGKPLYIGKAANLRQRVGQYFQKRDDPLIASLLERAAALETIVTAGEDEALLLESDLVHSHLPPFNIRLKDDKSFPSIEITLPGEFPGIYYSRRANPGSFVVGPLVNAGKARGLIDAVTRLFRLRTCSDTLFRRGIPCLYHHIERCSAPCAGKVDRDGYRGQVAAAVDFLKGRRGRTAAQLRRRMRALAQRQDFEAAQKAKEDLELLEGFSLRSCISTRRRRDSDVIAAALLGREAFFVHLAMSDRRVSRNGFFHQQTLSEGEAEALREFLVDFYRLRPLPGEVVVSRLPAQAEALARLLSKKAGRQVRIRIARRGEKKRLLDMAERNLALFVQKSDFRSLGEEIQRMLRLRHFPAHIEGFDISHLGEKNRVGAQVAFKNGQPEKRLYRGYVIRGAAPGDTGAMGEMLARRFRGPAPPPDLVLVDGGLPQLGAARQVKADLGLGCDLVALAKGEERAFLEDGTSLVLAPGTMARHLLQQVRDEVHRRAVMHHRKRREKI